MKLKAIAILLCFLIVSQPCFAMNENITVEKNAVTVSGTAEIPLQGITLQLLHPGKTEAESISDIVYQNQTEADEEGNYAFSFSLPKDLKSGEYTALLVYATGEKQSIVLPFKNDSDVDAAFSALKSAENPSYVKAVLEQYGENFGFDMSLYNALDDEGKNKAAELYISIPGNSENDIFKSAVAAAATMHYNGDFSDLVTGKFKDFTGFSETNAYKQFSSRLNLSEIGNRLKTVYIGNINTAKDRFTVEAGLWIIEQANGWYDVQQAVNLIAPVLQLDVSEFSKAPEAIGPLLAGKSYNETTFTAAFNEAVKGHASGQSVVFWDVAQHTPWANESVTELYKAGIVNGISSSEFNPNGNVTREQFAKMLISLLGDIEAASDSSFSDVAPDSWYAPFVSVAKVTGIVNGVSETEFGVGRNITREQMAAMIYRAGKLLGYAPNGAPKTFTDADLISDYAKESIDALTAGGVINGKADGSFAPQSTATRAEAACMIYNLMNATGHSNNTATGLELLLGVDPFVTYMENFNSFAHKDYTERDLVSVSGWYFVPNGASYISVCPAPSGKISEIPFTQRQKSENVTDTAVALIAKNSKASGFFDTEPLFMNQKTLGKLRLEMNLYLDSDSSSSAFKVFDMLFMAYESTDISHNMPFAYFAADGGLYYYTENGESVRCGSYAKNTWINLSADLDTENEIYTLYLNGTAVAKDIPFSDKNILWDGSDPTPALKKIRLRMGVVPDAAGNSNAYVDDFLWASYTDRPAISVKDVSENQITLSVPENIDEKTLEYISASVNGAPVNTTGTLNGGEYILNLPVSLKQGDTVQITAGKWVATTNGVITGTPHILTAVRR